MCSDLFPFIYSAVEEDCYIRQAISTVHPLMAYYAEPNCLYHVTMPDLYLPYSFLGGIEWNQSKPTFDYYSPAESAVILTQLSNSSQPQRVSILFDVSHPVMMR
jgi:hypothetical protein